MQNMIYLPGNTGAELDMPPDFYLSFEQMVVKYGFDVYKYSVTTPDNYVLGNFRIRSKNFKPGSPAIFM